MWQTLRSPYQTIMMALQCTVWFIGVRVPLVECSRAITCWETRAGVCSWDKCLRGFVGCTKYCKLGGWQKTGLGCWNRLECNICAWQGRLATGNSFIRSLEEASKDWTQWGCSLWVWPWLCARMLIVTVLHPTKICRSGVRKVQESNYCFCARWESSGSSTVLTDHCSMS